MQKCRGWPRNIVHCKIIHANIICWVDKPIVYWISKIKNGIKNDYFISFYCLLSCVFFLACTFKINQEHFYNILILTIHILCNTTLFLCLKYNHILVVQHYFIFILSYIHQFIHICIFDSQITII